LYFDEEEEEEGRIHDDDDDIERHIEKPHDEYI